MEREHGFGSWDNGGQRSKRWRWGFVRSFFVRMMLGVPVRLAELLGAILMHGMYIRTSLSKPRRSGVESLIAEL